MSNMKVLVWSTATQVKKWIEGSFTNVNDLSTKLAQEGFCVDNCDLKIRENGLMLDPHSEAGRGATLENLRSLGHDRQGNQTHDFSLVIVPAKQKQGNFFKRPNGPYQQPEKPKQKSIDTIIALSEARLKAHMDIKFQSLIEAFDEALKNLNQTVNQTLPDIEVIDQESPTQVDEFADFDLDDPNQYKSTATYNDEDEEDDW